MSVTGERDDLPGGGPQKVGVAVADLLTGMYADRRDPRGAAPSRRAPARASTSTWRCSTRRSRCWPTWARTTWSPASVPQRAGNAHPNIVPYQVFEPPTATADPRRRQRRPVRQVLRGRRPCPNWLRDPRFAKNADRVRNRAGAGAAAERRSCSAQARAHWIDGARGGRACRAVRSTTSPRCSPIRRCSSAACGRAAASARRRGAAGREPDQAVGDAGRAIDRAPPLLGAAHRRGAGRARASMPSDRRRCGAPARSDLRTRGGTTRSAVLNKPLGRKQ